MNPSDLKYTKEHEWVKVAGAEAIVGITDHAQSALGDITFIELPKAGRKVRQGESVSTVESVKAASDIYAPVSGEITAVNQELVNAPEIINKSAYEKGWLFKVKLASPDEVKSLMDNAAYEKLVKES